MSSGPVGPNGVLGDLCQVSGRMPLGVFKPTRFLLRRLVAKGSERATTFTKDPLPKARHRPCADSMSEVMVVFEAERSRSEPKSVTAC